MVPGEEIRQIVKEIDPDLLVPIHTGRPEMLPGIVKQTRLVEYGKPVSL